jgi:hypothetical protein
MDNQNTPINPQISSSNLLIHKIAKICLWVFIFCAAIFTLLLIIGVWVSTQTKVESNLEATFGFIAGLAIVINIGIRIVEGKKK